MNTKEALLLFKSKIMPFFDQGDFLYDISNADQARGLQFLQNKCLKIVYGKKNWTSATDAQRQSKILDTKEKNFIHH